MEEDLDEHNPQDHEFEEEIMSQEISVNAFDPADFDDFVRDIGLTKNNSEILELRLKTRGFLQPEVRICSARKRHSEFSTYFHTENNLTYCSNIPSLFSALNVKYDSCE
ncbi:hypothetical protein SNEBB_007124 [Seison nebaliae]|nr:hypothetical protein SNEBB_007124 [Seison nebaliae]